MSFMEQEKRSPFKTRGPIAEKLEDTKGVIRSRNSKDRQHNGKKGQMDKQRSPKQCTEN